MLTLVEELFLLSIIDGKDEVNFNHNEHLPYALAGAVLLELVLAGHLKLEKKRVVVVDPTATGQEMLDRLLERIERAEKVYKLNHWISEFAFSNKKWRSWMADLLVRRGILASCEKTFLWVIPCTAYIERDASAKYHIKNHLRAVVLTGEKADERAIGLLSLARAGDMLDHIFTKDEMATAKKHLRLMLATEEVGAVVMETIEEIESATAAVILTTTAG